MLLFTIWLKAFRQPRRFTFGWLVALKQGMPAPPQVQACGPSQG